MPEVAGSIPAHRLPREGRTKPINTMENDNKKMMVKLTELREWLDAGQVEFDVPGLVLTVDVDKTLACVEADALEANDRRRSKLMWLHSGLSHLAGEVLRGNPKAVGVVAEWSERRYSDEVKKGLLGKIAEVVAECQGGDDED